MLALRTLRTLRPWNRATAIGLPSSLDKDQDQDKERPTSFPHSDTFPSPDSSPHFVQKRGLMTTSGKFGLDDKLDPYEMKTMTKVAGDEGLRDHLQRIVLRTGQGLGVGALAAGTGLYLVPALGLGVGSYLLAFGTSLFSIYQVVKEVPKVETVEDIGGVRFAPKIQVKSSINRHIWYNIFGVSLGALTVPALMLYPHAVVPAAIGTAAVTGGTLMAGMMMPTKSTSTWGPPLLGGLLGLIGLGLGNAFIFHSPMLGTIYPYLGIGIFSMYNIYDLHTAVVEYEDGHLDDMTHAMNYVLNIWNIFLDLLQIIGKKD